MVLMGIFSFKKKQILTLATEFDETIVENNYPGIGRERPDATYALKELIKRGHRIILYSHRTGNELEAAVNWCMERGITFWAINPVTKEKKKRHTCIPKLKADLYLDGRNLGGMPEWKDILHTLCPGEPQVMKRR